MLLWTGLYLTFDKDLQSIWSLLKPNKSKSRKGDIAMFDKKEMKKIKMNKVGEYMMNGEPVFMVMMDGSLVEIEGASDMETIFFHSLTGGSFAVYRKKFEGIGNFAKSIKLGGWTLSINHEKKGGDVDVLDAGKEC
jgi:hypothetical protein